MSSRQAYTLLAFSLVVVLFATCMAADRPLLGATPAKCRSVEFGTAVDSAFFEVACVKGFKPTLP